MSLLKTKNAIKELLSLSVISKDKFLEELCKYNRVDKMLFYNEIITELKNAISEDNIECFKNWSRLLEYITLSIGTWDDVTDNLFENTNLVILACKQNRSEILKIILSKYCNIFDILNKTGNNNYEPNFEDEECHNSFYYAIRSGNIELLHTLIDKWPEDYFASRRDELEDLLSKAYEELKLKNVQLTNEIEYFVEDKLLNLRFFSNESSDYQPSHENIIKRMDLMLESINILKREYITGKAVDEKFIFIARFIAQNIHVLKRQVKSTYSILPWEEIEFCVVCFVSSYVKQYENNLFFCSVLRKERLLNHLQNFASKLDDVKHNMKLNKVSELPNLERKFVVESIVSDCNSFNELYDDYIQVRDLESLQKINDYIELSLSADCNENEGQMSVIRTLQIIGEHLKNTLESPKLSSTKSDLLILSTPDNTREILIELRNSLSHSYSLDKRVEIEDNADYTFYMNIQNDIKKIYIVINDMLYKSKLKIIKTLLKQIIDSKDFEEIIIVIEILQSTEHTIMKLICKEATDKYTSEHKKLREIVKKLHDKITDKTEYENELFSKILNLLETNTENLFPKDVKTECIQSLIYLQSINENYSDYEIDFNLIRTIKFYTKKALKAISSEVDVKSVKEVGGIAMLLLTSVKPRLMNCNEVVELFYKVFFIAEFEIDNIDGIEMLKEKLGRVKKKKKIKSNISKLDVDLENVLARKLSEIKNILKKVEHVNFIETLSAFKGINQTAIEMLILDVMSIMERSKLWHLNSVLFLDAHNPLLVGKCLRNYLAHSNALFDILLCDLTLAIFSNASTLSKQDDFKTPKIIGKPITDNPSNLRSRFRQSLTLLDNQNNMYVALEKGNLGTVKECLEKGADIKARRSNLWTALHYAAKTTVLEVVKFVLDRNSNIYIKEASGKTPFHVAVISERKCIIEYFLNCKGFLVDTPDNRGNTPLHMACISGHKGIVEFLLKHGANIYAKDKSGYSPMHRAVQKNHKELVKTLLQKGADINIEAIGGFTSLHMASERGYLELVKFLLLNKANVAARSVLGGTPLHLAVSYGHKEVAKALLLRKADVNSQVQDGCTALHFAIEYDFEETVKVLLDNGADVNLATTVYHYTSLHYGARHGNINIVKMLLQREANVNLVTTEGCTSLYLAAAGGHKDIVELLLLHKAAVNVAGTDGATALHVSVLSNHLDIIEILIENGAEINKKVNDGYTPLHDGSVLGYAEVMKVLIANGADVHATTNDGATALHLGVKNKDVMQLLIENKANVYAKNNKGLTSLHYAATNCRNPEVVNLLVLNGVEVNFIDNMGSTPLHTAAASGNIDIIKGLIGNGAIIDCKNCNNSTPLHFAVNRGSKEVTDLLLKYGANTNFEDTTGMTSLCHAVKQNNIEIVKVLISKDADVNVKNGLALKLAVNAGYKNIAKFFLTNCNINIKALNSTLQLAALRGLTDTIQLLINKGAEVDSKSENNKTSLLFAAEGGHEDVAKILIENGANVNFMSNSGATALEIAARNGHTNVVELLVKSRANINVKDKENRTPIEFAADGGHLEVVKILLKCKEVDINAKGNDNFTLLHISADKGHYDVVEYLVNNGADTNAKNSLGSKAIHIAAREGYQNIVEFFLNNGHNNINDRGIGGCTLLHYAVSKGCLEATKYLIDKKINVNEVDENGARPINIAATYGFKNVTELLIDNGAYYDPIVHAMTINGLYVDVNNQVLKKLRNTEKLFAAAKSNNILEVKICIKNGSFINAKSAENVTPLHFAAWKGYDDIIEFLLKNEANPNIVGKGGCTPLHYASKFNHLNSVKLLLSFGAFYNIRNLKGKTPLDCADSKEVNKFLAFITKLFNNIQNGNSEVIDDLRKVKDAYIMKAIMNSRNWFNNKALIATAINNDFPKIKQLKRIVEEIDFDDDRLVDLLISQEKYQEAVTVCNRIFERRKECLGSNNPSTLKIRSKMAVLLHKKGNLKEALVILEDVYLRQRETLGQNNEFTLSTRSSIALLLQTLGKNEEALNIFKEIYPKQVELLGKSHSDTEATKVHMALALIELKMYDEALRINSELYTKRKVTLGIHHPLTLCVYNNIAFVLSHQEKNKEALKIYREVYEIRKRIWGPHFSDTLKTLSNIARVLFQDNRIDEALRIYQEVHDGQRTTLGASHPDTVYTKINMGNLLLQQGKFTKAFEILTDDLNQIKAVFGQGHEVVVSIENLLKFINFQYKMSGFEHYKIPIYTAASNNDLNTINDLIKRGIDVNCKDSEGRASLYFAVNNGHKDILQVLLKNGADVLLTTNKGNTPLHTAVIKDCKDIVEILLQHVKQATPDKLKDFLNAKTIAGGTTALHVAAKNGMLEVVKCLLIHGAIYDIKDNKNKTPLEYTSHQGVANILKLTEEVFENAKHGNHGIVNKLNERKLEVKAVLNARNERFKTAVQEAISNKHKVLQKSLIKLLLRF